MDNRGRIRGKSQSFSFGVCGGGQKGKRKKSDEEEKKGRSEKEISEVNKTRGKAMPSSMVT